MANYIAGLCSVADGAVVLDRAVVIEADTLADATELAKLWSADFAASPDRVLHLFDGTPLAILTP